MLQKINLSVSGEWHNGLIRVEGYIRIHRVKIILQKQISRKGNILFRVALNKYLDGCRGTSS